MNSLRILTIKISIFIDPLFPGEDLIPDPHDLRRISLIKFHNDCFGHYLPSSNKLVFCSQVYSENIIPWDCHNRTLVKQVC